MKNDRKNDDDFVDKHKFGSDGNSHQVVVTTYSKTCPIKHDNSHDRSSSDASTQSILTPPSKDLSILLTGMV